MNLNKGVSTPIAILLIVAIAAVIAITVWQFKPTKEPVSKQASLQVISPNGGERWKENNTYDISWKSKKIDKVSIWLKHPSYVTEGPNSEQVFEKCKLNKNPIEAKQRSYSWTIKNDSCDFDIERGDSFKIAIYSVKNSDQVNDESDDYFIIGGDIFSRKLSGMLPFLWHDYKKAKQKGKEFKLADHQDMFSLWSDGQRYQPDSDSEPDAVGAFITIKKDAEMVEIKNKLEDNCGIIVNTTAGEIFTAVISFPEGLKCAVNTQEVKKIGAGPPVELHSYDE